MKIEKFENGPRAIFEATLLTQDPVGEDFLHDVYPTEEALLCAIEKYGYRLAEGLGMKVPDGLKDQVDDFHFRRHALIDWGYHAVGAIGVLRGGQEELDKLIRIIDDWRSSKTDGS